MQANVTHMLAQTQTCTHTYTHTLAHTQTHTRALATPSPHTSTWLYKQAHPPTPTQTHIQPPIHTHALDKHAGNGGSSSRSVTKLLRRLFPKIPKDRTLERYPPRIFLCSLMIQYYPAVVFQSSGPREEAVAVGAETQACLCVCACVYMRVCVCLLVHVVSTNQESGTCPAGSNLCDLCV